MRIRAVCQGVIALSLLAGAASADPFTDLGAFPTFYTDAGMKTMKPMAEFKRAWLPCQKASGTRWGGRATTQQ